MNSDAMTKLTEKGKMLIVWLLMAACFVGIPAALIYQAIDRHCQLAEHELANELKLDLQRALTEAAEGIKIEHYIAQRFDEQLQLLASKNNRAVIKWLNKERTAFANRFDYLIWEKSGKIIAKTNDANTHSQAWKEVHRELWQACYTRENGPDRHLKKKKTDLDLVRQVLGPQYVSRMAEDCAHPKFYTLGWADSSLKKPLFWTNSYKNRLYLLLFDPAIASSDLGIRRQLARYAASRPHTFGLSKNSGQNRELWSPNPLPQPQELASRLDKMTTDQETFSENSNSFLVIAFLTPGIELFTTAVKRYTPHQRLLYPLTGAMLFLVGMLPFLIYAWRVTIGAQPVSISIRPRIAFIFFFASAVPFLAMAIFAREHYSQKYDARLKEAHRSSLAILQNYDERMQSMWSRAEHNSKKHLAEWSKTMGGRELDAKSNQKLIDTFRDLLVDSYFLVASSSAIAGTYNGIERLSESLEQQSRESETGKKNRQGKPRYRSNDTQNAQIANIIGKRIMSELNGEARSSKESDRLELLFESLMQKSFAEITHAFIKAMGGLTPWGFGRTLNFALLNFMSAGNNEKIDFMALIIWSSPVIQENYLERSLGEINRNPHGLKVLACNHYNGKIYGSAIEISEDVRNCFNRIVERPSEEIDIVELDGQPYMLVGFIGKHLARYKIMGLYPVDRLERMIAGQRTDLMLFAAFCLILAAWLAQLLARSFLVPLNSLQEAAIAIEKRNFNHRIGDSGKDEFGETAAIFDEVMIGLEELAVARIVQESLFPQSALHSGKFEVYGKSLTMAELGGDYFDYFNIDDNFLAVLLGDVAGHGVGAALIMAMAKAGIIKSADLLKSPVKLLERLHDLIYSCKTRKQKKIMTFQYLVADNRLGQASYSNAGGCSPIFCRKGKVEEITLAGAALGSFRKAKLQQHEITFNPGDFMVFYTDGIIEARSQAGDEFGYTEFARLVAASADSCPEKIYQNICQGYYRHIEGMDAQDDLTLVIICYN